MCVVVTIIFNYTTNGHGWGGVLDFHIEIEFYDIFYDIFKYNYTDYELAPPVSTLARILTHSPLPPPLPLVLADASNEWLYNGSAVVSLELIQLKSWLTRRLDQENVTLPGGASKFDEVQNIKILRYESNRYNQFHLPPCL